MRDLVGGLAVGLIITMIVTGPLILFNGPSGIESILRPVVKQYYWDGRQFVPDARGGKDLPQVRIKYVDPGQRLCWSHFFVKRKSSAAGEPDVFSWKLTALDGTPFRLAQEIKFPGNDGTFRTTHPGFRGELNVCADWPPRLSGKEVGFTISAYAKYPTSHGFWPLERHIKRSLRWDGKTGLKQPKN